MAENIAAARRRAYLLTEGEPLIATPEPDGGVGRVAPPVIVEARQLDLLSDLGPGSEVTVAVAPFGTMPWPMLTPAAEGEHRFLSPEIDPAILWHPMFWLDREHAMPLYREVDGEIEFLEDIEEWLYRLFLELEHAGLYDRATGSWTDILDLELGLDIDQPEVQERLRAYAAGGEDGELDGINASRWIYAADDQHADGPNWAVERAMDEARIIALVAEAVQCHDLVEAIDTKGESIGMADLDEREFAVAVIEMVRHGIWFQTEDEVVVEGEKVGLASAFAEIAGALVERDGETVLADDISAASSLAICRQLLAAASTQLMARSDELAAELVDDGEQAALEA